MLGSPIDDNRSYSEQAAQKQQLKLHCTERPSVRKTETETAARLAERNQINPCYVAKEDTEMNRIKPRVSSLITEM